MLLQPGIPLIKTISPFIQNKAEFAACLVPLFDGYQQLLSLIEGLTGFEIDSTNNPDIIFRGNTVVTKSVDSFMKFTGEAYLGIVLGPILSQIAQSKTSYEVNKLKQNQLLEYNFLRLSLFS